MKSIGRDWKADIERGKKRLRHIRQIADRGQNGSAAQALSALESIVAYIDEEYRVGIIPPMPEAIRSDPQSVHFVWEPGLRMRLATLCMAATSGKEGDMRACTEQIIEFCKTLAGAEEK